MTRYTTFMGVEGEPLPQHTIENSTGSAFPARANLKFTGNVRVQDDGSNDATIVEVGSPNVEALTAQVAALENRIAALEA